MCNTARGDGEQLIMALSTANEPSISCHMTADQAGWRYYTYLAASRTMKVRMCHCSGIGV